MTQIRTDSGSLARPDCEDAVRAFRDSTCLRKSPALRDLVEYLWRYRDEELTEFRIATEALGRNTGFDPKFDATARVQLLRVRRKLKEYHGAEGKGAATRLTLPAGSYRFSLDSAPPEDEPAPASSPTGRVLPWILAAVCAAVAVTAVAWRFDARSPGPTPGGFRQLPAFWRAFTGNGKPVRIVLPQIAFFRWPHNTIKVRDTRVNRFDQLGESAELTELSRRWGTPEIMGNYTSGPDRRGGNRNRLPPVPLRSERHRGGLARGGARPERRLQPRTPGKRQDGRTWDPCSTA
jgi:hypothetical protein